MRWIFTPVLCLVFCLVVSSIPSQAQSNSVRYADYMGTYLISTPSFPVNDVTVYWQDSTLAFKAGGSKGLFDRKEADHFHFVSDDHEGMVVFKKNEQGKVDLIQIYMDGEVYEGTKKKPAGKSPK